MAETDDFAQSLERMSWWDRLGYRSKRAELVLYVAVLTGLPLWSGFGEPWPLLRWLMGGHVILSLILLPLVVVPFWLSHRRHLRDSTNLFLRRSGRIIEIGLLALVLSGAWLVLAGNRGATAGRVAYWTHLLAAAPLVALVLIHAWRYSLSRRVLAVLALAAALAALVSAPVWAASEAAAGHAVSSGSFVLAENGQALYSANFQAGSVSRIARADGSRTALAVLGGDIERIAVAEEAGLVAATDPVAGKLHLLRLGTLERVKTIDLPGRPMGVVADARNHLFWVTLFEGRRLLGIDSAGKTRVSLAVAETPRGLALLSDGRLLVTHAMVGQVSVIDTNAQPPVVARVITLASSSDPVETVSQGVPRLLDQIAISPDQTEAWLPHVLWNFDHPFQFQSTVFPAVSLLALTPGKEHEAVEHRKQLFKQINILEDGNRTRIVSNPDTAVFSEDGGKVYVTAAASEDLIVFDRSRSGGLAQSERRARRNNKLDQGGAKAVQIFRHLPGDNPRGVVVAGNSIYVQNAMSLDITRLDNGTRASADSEEDDANAFATVAVAQPQFARLVDADPVPAKLRRGLRLFFNGNTDDFPDLPMAGDNWMSCQSCHVDGFNFTNGYLFRDNKLNKFDNAIPGHAGLKTMVAGDFVGDYLRMVRDTQGGAGADTRFPTPDTNPDAPSPAAKAMMEDLHAYVTAPENLPFLSTWLRIDDPRGTTHPKEWLNSASCAECHTEMFDQWADSLHRLMANGNPYYRVVEDVAAKTEGEPFRMWCLACHQPQGVMSGLTKTSGASTLLEKGAVSLIEAHNKGEPVQEEGTGCMLCHRITRIEDAGLAGGANTSFTVNIKDRQTYLFEDARSEPAGWLGRTLINAKPDVHAQSYSQPFYKDPKLCATCHGEFAPGTGAVIVNTYGEWEASPYNRPDDPAVNRTCIDCHMHGDIARIGQDVPGRSTNGGKLKANVVTHQFTGANHHLVGLRNPKLAEMSVQLLKSAARLSVQPAANGQVTVRVANVGAGHSLPTGVADFREMWLDVTVTDARGQVVLRSGALDAEGNLDEHSARMFRKVFGDRDGKPVGLRFWRYEKMLEQTMIPAGGHRDEVYDLAADAVYPLKIEARLMFRIYPQWVTNAVRQQFPELPPPQPVEMTSLNQIVETPAP